MAHTQLKSFREELVPKVAQEDLAHMAGLRVGTYRNIEQGRNVSYTKAKAILGALNKIRVERGISEVTLDDLGLNIV